MRNLVIVISLALLGLAGPTRAHAEDAPVRPVAVNIIVVRAYRKAGVMDPQLKKQVKLTKQMRTAGFKSAQVSDTLSTTVEVGAKVGLEILGSPKPRRLLEVHVKEVIDKKTIKLTLAIEALKFQIDTEHTNGGTLVVAHPQGPDETLFLAVTPKL